MPSAHTAFAVSLLTPIGFFEGMYSGALAVTVGLAFIIVDDALRIRMILGDQGRYLNMLVNQLHGEIDESKFPHLKERVGHRTSEVVVGAIFGFCLTVILIALLDA
jgi:acid phosphatase family membrane protein YuiD